MNFSFYISGKGTRLSNIIDLNLEIIPYIKCVICDSKDCLYLKDKLNKKNIPFIFFDYDSIKKQKNNVNLELSNFILENFNNFDIDYCFCFGDHILKGDLLKIYKNKIINFHPSVLPLFRGRMSIDNAIESQSIILGNTAHFIDEGIDTGDIIQQIIIPKHYFKQIGYDGILNFQIKILMDIFSNLSKIIYDKSKIERFLPQIELLNIKNYKE